MSPDDSFPVYKEKDTLTNINTNIEYKGGVANGNNEQQKGQIATKSNTLFNKGNRDHHLLHLAVSLRKGGMTTEEIQQYLMFIGGRCNPPFTEKEIYAKIQSAIKRAGVKSKGITAAIREYVGQQSGIISITNALHEATMATSPEERKKVRVVMGRLEKEGLLKKTGRKAGEYYIVSQEHEIQDWKNASIESVDMVLPLGMHEAIRIVPGSIIMFSGVTNTGKTAFGMNIARWNCNPDKVIYLTSEIEQDEFKFRVESYCRNNHDSIDRWNVELIAKFQTQSLPDLINPEGLNIIDYLEPPDGDFTQIGPLITEIHHAMKGGITVIAIQKKEHDPFGAGGQFIRNKAHLFCTLDIEDYPVCRMKITKCKAPKHGFRNPNGLEVGYQIDVKDGLTIKPFGKLPFERWDRG